LVFNDELAEGFVLLNGHKIWLGNQHKYREF
jgi:hypothetical protein